MSTSPYYVTDQPRLDDEIDLLDLLKVLWRARGMIIGVTVMAVAAALIFTLTREPLYESQAVFAVQRETVPVGMQILRSRSLAERVVRVLDLAGRWGVEQEEAVRRLQETLSVSSTDRVITLSVRDPDPHLAKAIIDAYATGFSQMTNEIIVTADDQALAFIEARLREVEEQVAQAEARLRDFQREHGITSFEDQVELLVNARDRLEDQIRSLNVELVVRLSYLGERSPEVRELRGRLRELQRQLVALDSGGELAEQVLLQGARGELASEVASTSEVESQNLMPRFGLRSVPELSVELTRLQQEVSINRNMYQLLREQYEAAKVEVSRKLNSVRLIDPPSLPDEPVSRRLPLNLVLAGFLGFFTSTMAAFVGEFFRSRAADEEAVRELPFLRRFRKAQ